MNWKNWKKLLGLSGETEEINEKHKMKQMIRRMNQNMRIIEEFGWLWGIRSSWNYQTPDIKVKNVYEETENAEFQDLNDFFCRSPDDTQGVEVWLHAVGISSESVTKVNTQKGKSWGKCAKDTQKNCGVPVKDIVVIQGESVIIYHNKKSGRAYTFS